MHMTKLQCHVYMFPCLYIIDVSISIPILMVITALLLLYTSELFSILENKLIGYADDSTLMAVVPSPGARVTVAPN